MKPAELIRIIVLTLVGGLIMFLLQPLIYQKQIFPLNVPNSSAWVSNYYMTGALIVFLVSVISTIIWCTITGMSKAARNDEVEGMRIFWWLIGLLPLFSIFAAIFFYRGDDSALLSLTSLFLVDVFILYWLTTITSTPGLFKYLPPMSMFVRNLLGD